MRLASTWDRFQSTHPRGVRHARSSIFFSGLEFQSTHPRGVRRAAKEYRRCLLERFNPRTRVGCDIVMRFLSLCSGIVSIHAPAWGATLEHFQGRAINSFQSTHPRGVRLLGEKHGYLDNQFQSTHPRGVRRCAAAYKTHPSEVSIHAPAWGATSKDTAVLEGQLVSIHAPAWGATGTIYALTHILEVSIHAPAWGATVSMFYPVDSRD